MGLLSILIQSNSIHVKPCTAYSISNDLLHCSCFYHSSCVLSSYPILLTLAPSVEPTAPSPPRTLIPTGKQTHSAFELNWLPPLHPNGAVHYEIEYQPAVTPGDPVNAGSSGSPYFTLTLPNEFLTHNVRVAAVNTQGRAQSSVLPVCLGQKSQQGTQYMVPVRPTVLACMKLMVRHGQYLHEYS